MNKKRILNNILLSLITTFICLIASEFFFRYILFKASGKFEKIRKPEFYSNHFSDDYWKLYYLFGGSSIPPENTHPYLGWVGKFSPKNLDHNDRKKSKERRTVLLYGDSFAHCAEDVQCFEDILNNDSVFSKNYYLLNYGVQGYGLDQIYLLFDSTINKYEKPFIIISIMPGDLDRSVLSVRIGQKPFFIMEKESLMLKGVPVNPVSSNFFKENPPSIKSYLFSKFIYSDLNPFKFNPGLNENIRNKILTLNEKILQAMVKKLKSNNISFVFLIYEDLGNGDGNWRIDFLEKFFVENNLPFIYSTELRNKDTVFAAFDINNYHIKHNGHPTSHYNTLVSEELKKYIFSFPEYSYMEMERHKMMIDTTSIEHFVFKIRQDKNWLKSIEAKAIANNIPLDSMIKLDAAWSRDQARNKPLKIK